MLQLDYKIQCQLGPNANKGKGGQGQNYMQDYLTERRLRCLQIISRSEISSRWCPLSRPRVPRGYDGSLGGTEFYCKDINNLTENGTKLNRCRMT